MADFRDAQYQFIDGHWRDVWNDADDTQEHPDPDVDWAEAIVMMGWCGCGWPEMVRQTMARFLRSFVERPNGARVSPMLEVPVGLLLAYRAAELGFTEHGGSIYGAWLTPAGERWLELADG